MNTDELRRRVSKVNAAVGDSRRSGLYAMPDGTRAFVDFDCEERWIRSMVEHDERREELLHETHKKLTDTKQERDALRAESERLRHLLQRAHEAIGWMTGSADFGQGGQAHEGFKMLVHPLRQDMRAALDRAEEKTDVT